AGDATPARDVTVYVREGCPHCADAKAFLATLQATRPGLRVVVRDVVADPEAARDAERISLAAGVWPPGVPIIVIDGTVIVGFDDAEHMGRQIEALIDRGAAPTTEVPTRWFGTLSATTMGLPAFTLALGLLDGFNPCAMWVLLFLLSLLVRLHDRRRMALIAGTFVAVSGAVYYAFMAAWLNVFLVIGMTNALRWTLAGVAAVIGAVNVKDFVAFGRGASFSIPESAKPGLYARVRHVVNAPTLAVSLAAVTALAVVVNFVELLCTAGLPALYTAVLAQHDVSAAGRYAYLGLYIVGYVADDALMVALAVAALGQRKLTERAGRWLKLVSGVVMLALAAVLALRPQLLM
ncbi:MAG: NrdH-redoxin, partial [Rubrivivax sp.]|nr:NrdH-redoxin [Rubrivivax sp.]